MRAVILAGGRGSRLAPLTATAPKPLLPLGDMPILELIIRQLASAGINHITLALGHMSTHFDTFLARRPSLKALARIDSIVEEKPLGTAGALALVPGLAGDFLVANGDIFTNLDYRNFLIHHHNHRGVLTIGMHPKKVMIDFGVIQTDADGTVIEYVEKPSFSCGVSMGIYACGDTVLSHLIRGEHLDFPVLVRRLLAAGQKVITYASDAYWLDVGRSEDLCLAAEIFARRRHEFVPDVPETARRRAS